MLFAVPFDLVHGGIGLGPCLVEAVAERDDGEHAATCGDDVSGLGDVFGDDSVLGSEPGAGIGGAGGPGMEDVHVVEVVGRVEAADDVARAGCARVVLGGHDHGHRGARIPVEVTDLVEAPLGGGEHGLSQRAAQAGEHGLGLGVAEADVELHDSHSLRGQGESAVEETDERGAAAGHLIDDRLGDGGDDVVDGAGWDPQQR